MKHLYSIKFLTTPKLGKKLDEKISQRKALWTENLSSMSSPILMPQPILMIVTYAATQLFPIYKKYICAIWATNLCWINCAPLLWLGFGVELYICDLIGGLLYLWTVCKIHLLTIIWVHPMKNIENVDNNIVTIYFSANIGYLFKMIHYWLSKLIACLWTRRNQIRKR